MPLFHKIHHYCLSALLAALAAAAPAAAEQGAYPAWRSLRDPVVNMRVGPGEEYAIRFVYHRQHLPIKVLRSYQGWYFVEDSDGARGWMMGRFLTKGQSALIRGKGPVEMHAGAGAGTPLLWRLAPGVIGRLGGCKDGWCQLDVDHHVGFVPQDRLWGVGKP